MNTKLLNSLKATNELNIKLLDENTRLKLELKSKKNPDINDLINWAQNNGLGFIHKSDLQRFADKCLTS